MKIKMIRNDIESIGEANVVIESDGLLVNNNKLYFKDNLWNVLGAFYTDDKLIEALEYVFKTLVKDSQYICIKTKDFLGDLIITVGADDIYDVYDFDEHVVFDIEKLNQMEF